MSEIYTLSGVVMQKRNSIFDTLKMKQNIIYIFYLNKSIPHARARTNDRK